MIRVLHSVSNMDRAGIETMLMNYYRNMDFSKVQFDFLCNKKKSGAYDEEIKKLGGKIYHTPGLNPIKFFKYQRYMKELFSKHPEYQIIHVHNGALGIYALYAAKKNKISHRIFHAHGASITLDLKWPLKMVCKSQLLNYCNQNWTCGVEAAKCYFGRKIVKQGNYHLVNNAIDAEKFTYSEKIRNKIREEYNLQGKIIIGHVGRFMRQKNHKFLIEVFARISRLEEKAVLVLLGDGELMDNIKKKVSELEITEKVIFIGNVGNVNEWYSAFDVFVLPSIWEGLPVVGIEAQAADLPCVFSSNVTKEIKLSEKANFMELEASVDEWAKCIIEKSRYSARKYNTDLITKKNYNIHIEAKKLEKQYLDIYGEKI